MNGKQIIKKLELLGWKLDRINGSHHVMVKEGMRSVSVPVHGSKNLDKGMISALQKQTGVKFK